MTPNVLSVRKVMMNLILAAFLIFISCNASAKLLNYISIEIRPDGIYIEGYLVTRNSPFSKYEAILGKPSRITRLLNTIYTYDDLGILLYQEPEKNTIKSISLDFIKSEHDFSPIHSFNGLLVIKDKAVRKSFTQKELYATDLVHVNQKDNVLNFVTQASYGRVNLIFEYLESRNLLEGVAISWRSE